MFKILVCKPPSQLRDVCSLIGLSFLSIKLNFNIAQLNNKIFYLKLNTFQEINAMFSIYEIRMICSASKLCNYNIT